MFTSELTAQELAILADYQAALADPCATLAEAQHAFDAATTPLRQAAIAALEALPPEEKSDAHAVELAVVAAGAIIDYLALTESEGS